MVVRQILAFVCLSALGACTLAPNYERPALPVSSTFPQGSAYPSAGGPNSDLTDLGWRDFFVDTRLQRLIDLALVNNRDLRVAVEHVVQARAQYQAQRADLLPTVAAGASPTFEQIPPGLAGLTGSPGSTAALAAGSPSSRIDLYSVTLGTTNWEVDLFGRLQSLTQAAQQQYFAADRNRDAARIALIAQVASTYLAMASDQDRLKLAENTAQAFGQTLEITRGRADEGVSSDLDVRQAQTTYEQARADIAADLAAVAQDKNALELLVGAGVPENLLPDRLGEKDATVSQLPVGLSSAVLLRRPDVAAAEHQLRAANADIGAARAAFFPQISLTAAYGTLGVGLSNLFRSGGEYWSVAPSASLPIFDFGRNRANLHFAESARREMVAQYEKAVQSAFREVADALALRGTLGARIEAETSQRDAAEAAYMLAQARYTEGADTFLNTLDSERSLYTAQQNLLAVRLQRQSNAVDLYRALGGGLK